MMSCPRCGSEMIVKKRDISNDSRSGKAYDRAVYFCERDDAWITVETPKV